MGVLAWIVVGLIAGWLAGQVRKRGGYGVWPGGGMIGSIICGICWRCDFGLAYSLTEKSLRRPLSSH
jgi:hypothetical protein